MSGNYFAVDTDALATAAPEIMRLAQRVNRVNSLLESRTSALGECWGHDAGGRQFAQQYMRPRNQLLKGLGSASKVLDSMADGVQTMAKGFSKTEEQAIEAANDFRNSANDRS
ncbi:WXG100 family type VII secretion target [Streptomyces dysideae]|uniref:WXG100 family type VII secretion target n=1 Tax=Streptomyces dysideae TaxID=909626 RepID=A0A101URM0_9ACTN|nr:hypothetical protein [Streptomyces dysideae]KUO15552.1 hypothetical protein AQJ91_40865 [Streptomyces dysideae]